MAVFAKLLATILRGAQLLGTLYNTGCCTYLIVGLSNRNLLDGRALAVEIISAASLLWAAFVLIFTICLLQKTFFQFFTIFGDVLFMGGNIAVAVLLRDAFSRNCSASGLNVAWLERGGRNLDVNCELIKGIFLVSIILAVLFLLTCLTAFLAHRSSKKDRAYGPSPANNYTTGRGKRGKNDDVEAVAMAPALAPPAHDNRVSHDSKFTDITEKTNGEATHNTAGREYLAPRANNYAGTETTVSPNPSSTNLRNKDHSHAGQYAMAGALAGGAATAHHQHKKNAYGQHDSLPNHPGPEDHTTEHVPMGYNQDHLGTMNTYNTNTNSMYSELDNTTTTGPPSSYATPGAYPGSRGAIQPTAYYPAAQSPSELPSNTGSNPHYYSTEMDGGYNTYPQEMDSGKQYDDYLTPATPVNDQNREQVGFGYGNGPGMVGGGSNQVSTLPEIGREDGRRF